MAELLTDDQIAEFCEQHPRWQRDGDALVAQVKAASFLEGIDQVGAVAQVAEEMDHHPDIDIRWRTLTFRLSTHSHGGITDLDTALAQRIDAIAGELP